MKSVKRAVLLVLCVVLMSAALTACEGSFAVGAGAATPKDALKNVFHQTDIDISLMKIECDNYNDKITFTFRVTSANGFNLGISSLDGKESVNGYVADSETSIVADPRKFTDFEIGYASADLITNHFISKAEELRTVEYGFAFTITNKDTGSKLADTNVLKVKYSDAQK
jgi:hypothetical protein